MISLTQLFLPTALLALLLVGCSHPTEPEAEELPTVSVQTLTAKSEEAPIFDEVVGTVRPRLEADVSAKVTGRILTMEATPGRRVAEGEVLSTVEVNELRASLEGAQATLDQAKRDLVRTENLYASKAASKSNLEQTRAREQVSTAQVKELQIMIENAAVKAPFDGVVTRKLAESGDLAIPGRPLFRMEDPSLLRLEINVAESLAGQIELGQTFHVHVEGADADCEGTVAEIAPSADVGSRTFLVKLDLPKLESLRAGQFGRAFLPRGTRRTLQIPVSSLIQRGQMDYVFVAGEDNLARLRIVRTGQEDGDQVEILAGLEDGEEVIAVPPAELHDGQPLSRK